MQPCFWQFRPTNFVARSIADEMSGVSTKKSLPPEGAAGLKIEGWGLLERSPLERPDLSLVIRSRPRTQTADWVKLLTEQDVKKRVLGESTADV